MRIFIDADSCPPRVRTIVAKAAAREGLEAEWVANRALAVAEPSVRMVVVEKGEGKADDYIVENCSAGDLVVTRDIPLAARLVDAGVFVINDRGDVFTRENIGERLSVRNLMKEFRECGIMPEGERTFGDREVKLFANAFDRELRKALRSHAGTDG